jgi:hypothetical protein
MCWFLRPFIWSRVSSLMRFRKRSDKCTLSNFVQISVKVWRRRWKRLDKRAEKKAWAVHGKSKLTETEKSQTGEEQSRRCLWHQRDCSQRIRPGAPVTSAYCCDVLQRLCENVRRHRFELWDERTDWCITMHRLTPSFSAGIFLPKTTWLSPTPTHPTFLCLRLKIAVQWSFPIVSPDTGSTREITRTLLGIYTGCVMFWVNSSHTVTMTTYWYSP